MVCEGDSAMYFYWLLTRGVSTESEPFAQGVESVDSMDCKRFQLLSHLGRRGTANFDDFIKESAAAP
jgi:hypothetical protein